MGKRQLHLPTNGATDCHSSDLHVCTSEKCSNMRRSSCFVASTLWSLQVYPGYSKLSWCTYGPKLDILVGRLVYMQWREWGSGHA
jgi:hypothetical protein